MKRFNRFKKWIGLFLKRLLAILLLLFLSVVAFYPVIKAFADWNFWWVLGLAVSIPFSVFLARGFNAIIFEPSNFQKG